MKPRPAPKSQPAPRLLPPAGLRLAHQYPPTPRRTHPRATHSSGFTIIEILMVILLVGIVSAVVVPNYIDFAGEAKRTTTQQKLNELKMAITGDPRAVANGTYLQPGYENHVGSLPATLNDLRVQGAAAAYDPFTKRGWRGPYITTTDANWDKDGWGTTITYTSATRTLRSCGPNRTCGNADDITITF